MNRIRKGDAVIVTAGSEKGRTGTVVGVNADGRVLVEGVNMVKKHQRPNPARGVQGKGYKRSQFKDAWERYLPPENPPSLADQGQ